MGKLEPITSGFAELHVPRRLNFSSLEPKEIEKARGPHAPDRVRKHILDVQEEHDNRLENMELVLASLIGEVRRDKTLPETVTGFFKRIMKGDRHA